MRLRNIAAVTLSISLAFSLSACGAGKDSATRMTTQVTDGVDGSVTTLGNNIKVSSLLLVTQTDGSAVVVGTIVNENPTPDSLLAIGINGKVATLSSTTLPLVQNMPIRFAGDTSNASAVLPGLNAVAGTRQTVQLFFANAGELDLDALVRARSGVYANVGA